MTDAATHAPTRLGAPFWRVWAADTVDNLGDGALTAAVGLLATLITRDPRAVAVVTAASTLPWLLLTLPAGVLADRVDRVRAMHVAQWVQAAAMAALTVLTAVHVIGIGGLAMLAFVVTAGDVMVGMASQAVLPELVAKPLLIKANSLSYTTEQISYSFLGKPLGSLLFAVAPWLPFGANTASYVVSAGLLATLPRPARTAPRQRKNVWADTAEGLRWLAQHRLLRTLAVVLGLNNFANQLGTTILVLFATETLGVSRAHYGWLLAASSVGGVLGGLVNRRIVGRIGSVAALVGALAVNAAVYVAVSLVTDAVAVGVLLAVTGFAVTVWNVVSVSMRQELVPPELLGRVNSVYRLLGWGMLPLGALAGGFLAHWLGLREPFLVAGLLRFAVLAAALPVLLPTLRSTTGRASRRRAAG